jgi:O-antigen biosynthesis protein
VVSSYELQQLSELLPTAVIHHLPILRETPPRSAGEALHWRLRQSRARLGRLGRWLNRRDPSLQRRSDVLFIGGYEHRPNVDAVKWFVRDVWPVLQSRNFPHRFVIAGSNLPEEIAVLASDRIDIRGHVDDLARLFAACRLSVAPLRYGAGVKGKIVSSLSHGVPVVATSIAAEGAGLQHGKTILVADTPETMADLIMKLFDDDDLWQALSAQGYQAFRDTFSLEAGARKVLAVVDGLVASVRR